MHIVSPFGLDIIAVGSLKRRIVISNAW